MERIRYWQVNAPAFSAMRDLQSHVDQSGLDGSLVEMLKLRASYINGCAFCVDMHTKDARAAGETEQRLFGVPVWRETPYYTPRERAALAWTEAVTQLSGAGISNEAFEEVRQHFDEAELVDLTLAIVAINGWNRLAVAFGTPAGSYQVDHTAGVAS